jgi:tRNA (guanosine-2'-O-)-methyltransferase
MKREDRKAHVLNAGCALPASAEQVIAALQPLLSEERIARIDAVISHRTHTVVPVLEAVDDPRNVSAVLRSAEAFGLQEVHLVTGSQPFMASRLITQGAERWLDLRWHEGPDACVAALRTRGFKVYVASMDGARRPEDLSAVDKAAIVFGNEKTGVGAALAALADERVAVPMSGFSQSLNVSVAAAITLYAATRGRSSELDENARTELRARYMLLSVARGEEVVAEQLSRRPG